MQPNQFIAQRTQRPEQISVGGERQAWEVDLEKLGVALAVARRVEDSVQIAEHILWPKGLLPISLAILYPGHA